MSEKTDPSKRKDDKSSGKQKPSGNENQCPICLENITNKSRTDPCSHEFCLQCLRHWANDHNFCPVCRQVFDRILYNFRADNNYDSIIVDNRQSRVRGSLFNQRDALRQTLTRIRHRVDQQMETLRRNLREREGIRNRITQHLVRINSLDRQNNEEIDQTLNQVRNTINEINYQNFIENLPGHENDHDHSTTISDGVESMGTQYYNYLLRLSPRHWSDSLTVNGGPVSVSDSVILGVPGSSLRSTSSRTDSELNSGMGSNPTSIEWQILGPNTVGTITLSSNENENSSTRTIRSSIVSHSTTDSHNFEDMSSEPLLSGSLFSGPTNQNLLQNIPNFHGFDDIENRMNDMVENMLRPNRHHIFAPISGSSNTRQTGNTPAYLRPVSYPLSATPYPRLTPQRLNGERAQNISSNRNSQNNATLQRNLNFMNRFNQRQRSFTQRARDLEQTSDDEYESDTDSD